jgi:hypothetical protein
MRSGRGVRYQVKTHLITHPELLSEPNSVVVNSVKASGISAAENSIRAFRWDFVLTMQALKAEGRLTGQVAKYVRDADKVTWHHRFNQILFHERFLDEATIRARLTKEGLPPGERDLLKASIPATLESLSVLCEHGAITTESTA